MRLAAAIVLMTVVVTGAAAAQDLSPRAYTLTPIASNAVILTYAFTKGDILFDPTIPVTDAHATVHTPVLSYYRSFDLFGRLANATVSVPWASGNFSATVAATDRQAHREGLGDTVLRFAIDFKGGTARPLREFVKTPPPRTIIGASFRAVAPTGQYTASRAINVGNNRWAFKPEVGISRRVDRLLIDGYGGVWFFTKNGNYLAPSDDVRGSLRQQSPIASFEGHVSYDIKPRFWLSADVNYWYGGKTTVNGVQSLTSLQANSRIGVTGSVPISRSQALKCSYSDGVVTRVGGTFKVLSVAWQYSWFGNPLRRSP
jgi:outer membrane putative beta-barrel porin/alpha-amylase